MTFNRSKESDGCCFSTTQHDHLIFTMNIFQVHYRRDFRRSDSKEINSFSFIPIIINMDNQLSYIPLTELSLMCHQLYIVKHGLYKTQLTNNILEISKVLCICHILMYLMNEYEINHKSINAFYNTFFEI